MLILFVTGLTYTYTLSETKKALKEMVRSELNAISTLMAVELSGHDADSLKKLQPGDEKTSEYLRLKSKLQAFQNIHPDIKYIYTMTKSGDDLFFIVDPMYGNSKDPGAAIGEKYDEQNDNMLAGFTKTSTEQEYYSDKWGTFLSSYSPIRDSNNEVIGIIGADISAATVFEKQNFIGQTIYLIMIGSILLATLIIFVFSITIIKDIHKLNRAANDISLGNVNVEIDVVRKDEIGELAKSFGRMVASLKIMMQK